MNECLHGKLCVHVVWCVLSWIKILERQKIDDCLMKVEEGKFSFDKYPKSFFSESRKLSWLITILSDSRKIMKSESRWRKRRKNRIKFKPLINSNKYWQQWDKKKVKEDEKNCGWKIKRRTFPNFNFHQFSS